MAAHPLDMMRPWRREPSGGVATTVKATAAGPRWREKPDREFGNCPYRTPTQVGRDKCPEVDERTFVKELGKLTP